MNSTRAHVNRRQLAASAVIAVGLLAPRPAAAQGLPAVEPLSESTAGFTAGRPASSASTVRMTCERIGRKLSSVSFEECSARRLEDSGGRSVAGAPILLREFLPLADREPLGRVLLFGGIHGDEYSSVTIVFKWMSLLDRYHSGLFHWRVVPLLNPDGLLRQQPQRMNHRGVDLNRNFPTLNWVEETEDYWVRRTGRNPRRYPGPAPLSEPESNWLLEEIESFQPSVIVSVHAPSHVVDYDGPPEAPEKLGSLYLRQIGTYPGSLGRYAGVQLGIPIVTIELPSAGVMPATVEQRKIWTDLVAWLADHISSRGGVQVASMAPKPGDRPESSATATRASAAAAGQCPIRHPVLRSGQICCY